MQIQFDREHIWHPYTSATKPQKQFLVESAQGVVLHMADGKELIDGMSSWWSAIHGYNHPVLNEALLAQSQKMNHVMFGGLTHQPAIELSRLLIEITPEPLQHIFLADSGSISVEVAMKMALQYQFNSGKTEKRRFGSLCNGYHGDTFGAMSLSDPITGMHSLFEGSIQKQIFITAPSTPFGEPLNETDAKALNRFFLNHHTELAAIILEPIVQGAGGMRFYSAEYLTEVKRLCELHDVLLIIDEIATGFARTGKLFASEHSDICADILCLGKALTGGQMTLAATLTTKEVAHGVCKGDSVLMHGPTFMGNPLACAVAVASCKLLLESDWQNRIETINTVLSSELSKAQEIDGVQEVRTLGAIGVIELEESVDMTIIQPMFVDAGVWIRPFGKLVYTMPPYTISEAELQTLTEKMVEVVREYLG